MHVFGAVLGWHFLGKGAQLSQKGAPKGVPEHHFWGHLFSTMFSGGRYGAQMGPSVDLGAIVDLFWTLFGACFCMLCFNV